MELKKELRRKKNTYFDFEKIQRVLPGENTIQDFCLFVWLFLTILGGRCSFRYVWNSYLRRLTNNFIHIALIKNKIYKVLLHIKRGIHTDSPTNRKPTLKQWKKQ